MTADRELKRRIRRRCAYTGENYQTALQALRAEPDGTPPIPPAAGKAQRALEAAVLTALVFSPVEPLPTLPIAAVTPRSGGMDLELIADGPDAFCAAVQPLLAGSATAPFGSTPHLIATVRDRGVLLQAKDSTAAIRVRCKPSRWRDALRRTGQQPIADPQRRLPRLTLNQLWLQHPDEHAQPSTSFVASQLLRRAHALRHPEAVDWLRTLFPVDGAVLWPSWAVFAGGQVLLDEEFGVGIGDWGSIRFIVDGQTSRRRPSPMVATEAVEAPAPPQQHQPRDEPDARITDALRELLAEAVDEMCAHALPGEDLPPDTVDQLPFPIESPIMGYIYMEPDTLIWEPVTSFGSGGLLKVRMSGTVDVAGTADRDDVTADYHYISIWDTTPNSPTVSVEVSYRATIFFDVSVSADRESILDVGVDGIDILGPLG